MKLKSDPRHQKRVSQLKQLFSYAFPRQTPSSSSDIQPVVDHLSKIDLLIKSAAPEWPISQINRIDVSILRLAIFELTQKHAPTKVIIDEAVELAKEFGSDSSPKFVNGVLGTVTNHLNQNL